MPYTASTPSLFNNTGGTQAPRQPIDIAGAVESLSQGAGSLIHQTLLRKQAEFERQHQMNQEAIERQHWEQQAGWHQAQTDAENRRWEAENADRIQRTKDAATAAGIVRGAPAQPGTPDTSATIAPSAANVTPTAPGQFSDQPVVNPILKAITKGSVQGAPQVSAPAMAPTYARTGTPTPSPTTITAPGKPAKGATPDTYDPDYDRNLQRTVAGATIRGQSAEKVAEIRAAATRASRAAAGEKPVMVGGNPYYKNKETGHLEPATDAEGQPLTIAAVPQKPPTQNQTSVDTSRKLGTVKQQIDDAQRTLAGAVADHDAKTAATKGKDATDQKNFSIFHAANAARAKREAAQARVDKLTALRDSMATAQRVAGGTSATAPLVSDKPAGDESGVSDADLWEQKVQGGMTKDAATAYVKGRKKP